jgi:hypothetical protein
MLNILVLVLFAVVIAAVVGVKYIESRVVKRYYRVKGKGSQFIPTSGLWSMLGRLLPYPGKDKAKTASIRIFEDYKRVGTEGVFHSFLGPLSNIVRTNN